MAAVKRTVRLRSAVYRDADGVMRRGRTGEEVRVHSDDVDRFDRFNVIAGADAEPPHPPPAPNSEPETKPVPDPDPEPETKSEPEEKPEPQTEPEPEPAPAKPPARKSTRKPATEE